MRIALAQINPTVGDLLGNGRKIVDFARRAANRDADVVVFPELSVTGYPPQDLLEKSAFIDDVDDVVDWIAREIPGGMGAIVGAPVRNTARTGKRLYNAAVLLADGEIAARSFKSLLPTYDVYDEYRYFEPAHERTCMEWKGVRLGVHICEDMWNMETDADFRMYAENPLEDLARDGAELFVSLSATPFALGKRAHRTRVIRGVCRHFGKPLVMVNQVGADSELVFDGSSAVYDASGRIVAAAPAFEESFVIWDSETHAPAAQAEMSEPDALHRALVLGIRDYFQKTHAFDKVVLGLSGGIDSALTCVLAVEALGREKVVGVSMPSEYTSKRSREDAERLAQNLGIELHEISIQPAFKAYQEMLGSLFAGTEPGIAEENLQARARGATLMAISNKFDYLLLTTGNKSEMAVGYVTLYGDLTGGLAVLSDVYKTQVSELAERLNARAGSDLIPPSTIDRPPSAELRPNQKDQDTLPPYDLLDPILKHYIEDAMEPEAIANATGADQNLVLRILKMVDQAEFKRRQAPPGLRVTTKAFGSGRRLPLIPAWIRHRENRLPV